LGEVGGRIITGYKYRLKIKINDKVLGNGFFGKEASSAPI
jgi:hypothetical protein